MRLTFEFFVELSSTCYAKCADELLKVDGAVLVLVEDIEYKVGEFAGLAKWEELLIDPGKFGPIELTRRTILEEALIPKRNEGNEQGTG